MRNCSARPYLLVVVGAIALGCASQTGTVTIKASPSGKQSPKATPTPSSRPSVPQSPTPTPNANATPSPGPAPTQQASVAPPSPTVPPTVVSTVAGNSTAGFVQGGGNTARFNAPTGLAIDTTNTLYVADSGNYAIRRIDPAGSVSVYAGSPTQGFADGPRLSAAFTNPTGLAIAPDGRLFVSDRSDDGSNHSIRVIDTRGVVSTLTGSRTGFVDGPAANALFHDPCGIDFGSGDTLYIADRLNHRVRSIATSGAVTTIAGQAAFGLLDGQGSAAKFNQPMSLVADTAGNVFVSDTRNHCVRWIKNTGEVRLLAGSNQSTAGKADGQGVNARFREPGGLALDTQGNLYLADSGNHRICKITPSGLVSTLTGTDVAAERKDGTLAEARFNYPTGLAMGTNGSLYVCDTNNHAIRRIILPQ